MQNLRDTYNRIAEDWHNDHISDQWWIEGAVKFLKYLKPGDSVLDVGCAGGVKSKYLTENGMKVLGIDVSEKMIEIARQYSPAAEFQVLDMRKIGALSKKFKAVFAQASILHLPKKEASGVVKQFAEILEPSGICYISVKEKRPNGVDEEEIVETDYGYDYQRLFSYYSADDLRQYLTDAGFILREVWTIAAGKSGKTIWLQVIGEKK